MIAYIKGELVETLTGSVILDVHGIGYRIYISGRESEQLTKMGSQVKLHTYFHVKEHSSLNCTLSLYNTFPFLMS